MNDLSIKKSIGTRNPQLALSTFNTYSRKNRNSVIQLDFITTIISKKVFEFIYLSLQQISLQTYLTLAFSSSSDTKSSLTYVDF